MAGLSCNSCNKEFVDDVEQKLHYKSDWHRYNLKRKVAGVPGVTESLFEARQAALIQEQNKSDETPMLYSCNLCGKGYRSVKAHAQHLKSRSHIILASQGSNNHEGEKAAIKPLPPRVVNKPLVPKEAEIEESDDESEWQEADSDEDLVGEASKSSSNMNIAGVDANDMDEDLDNIDMENELNPSTCFMCDQEHATIESCMVHMHKHHGFFIPDVEYLKDPKGLLTYLGLKVKRDFVCLYCNDRCHPFNCLEAVRKHMDAKSHCKVHYGDDDEEEEAELEEFYDYSSSYVGEAGQQLIAVDDNDNTIELGSGGVELIISRRNENKVSTKSLGSREFLRYYRQKPRPSPTNQLSITAALAARYKSMGIITMQSRQQRINMKVMKQMSRSGVEVMRSKMGMKSNVIRNLPKNCTY